MKITKLDKLDIRKIKGIPSSSLWYVVGFSVVAYSVVLTIWFFTTYWLRVQFPVRMERQRLFIITEKPRDVQASGVGGVVVESIPFYCQTNIEKLICNPRYKWDNRVMIAIGIVESKMNPNAFNLNTDGSYDIGILQVNSSNRYAPNALFDPKGNIQAGYEVWEKQGYGAWTLFGTPEFVKVFEEVMMRGAEK